jgi:dTDP-4-amino-4,6-dideoxygalactose transaminase
MKKIALFKPYVSWLSRLYALMVLSGTQLAEGPVVRAFEKAFADYIGVARSRVIAVNSGSSALELAYELAGVGPGDEVITPVLTCTATNLPILHRGAKVVFADIDHTLNVSPEDVERKITPKTKAIVFVHFGGNSHNLFEVLSIADKYGIPVIEDAAQCVGSEYAWCRAAYVCVSLQAIKTLTAGDGGFLICKDPVQIARAKRLRWFGYDRAEKQKKGDMDLTEAGYKYHMNDITAAIGLGNLRRLPSVLAKREKVRRWYAKHIDHVHLYPWLVILVHPFAREIDKALKENGIGSGPYHYRNDKYSIFGAREYGETVEDAFPNMDRLQEQYTLLPFHHDITERDVERIAGLIEDVEWRHVLRPYHAIQRDALAALLEYGCTK